MAMAEKADMAAAGVSSSSSSSPRTARTKETPRPSYPGTYLLTYLLKHVFMDERDILKHPSSSTVFIHNDSFDHLPIYPFLQMRNCFATFIMFGNYSSTMTDFSIDNRPPPAGGGGGGLLTPNFYSFPSNSFTIVLNFHGKFYFLVFFF